MLFDLIAHIAITVIFGGLSGVYEKLSWGSSTSVEGESGDLVNEVDVHEGELLGAPDRS